MVAMLSFCFAVGGGLTGSSPIFTHCLRRFENICFGSRAVNKNPLYGGYFYSDHHILCFMPFFPQAFLFVLFLALEQVLPICTAREESGKPQRK